MGVGGLVARVRSWLGLGPADAEGTEALGRRGEARAKSLLSSKGYRILAKNVRLGFAEADIVCEAPDKRTIVIVEVKTRRAGAVGGRARPAPEASVGARKKRKLLAAARYLVKANGWQGRPVRVDAVSVEWGREGEPTLRHMIGVADDNR